MNPVRLATRKDLEQISRWHGAMNPWVPLPKLERFLVMTNGQVAAGVDLIGEAWIWYDVNTASFVRAKGIAELNRALPEMELAAWVPPALDEEFGVMLGRLGWVKSPWPVWCRARSAEGK